MAEASDMTMANGAAAAAEPVRPGSDSGSGSASVGSGVGGTPVKSASAAPHKPVLLRAHDKPFAFEKKLVDFIYDRTCTCMCACLCTMFLLTLIVIGGGLMVLSEPTEYDWTISDSDVSRNLDAMQDATSRVDAVSGGSSSSSSTAERTEVRWIEALSIMYTRADERRDVSVFTPEGVQDMCELENLMLAHPDYRNYCVLDAGGKCDKQPKSVSSYFYSSGQTLESWGYGAYDCVLLDQGTVDAGANQLQTLITSGTPQQKITVGFFLSSTAPTDGFSFATRSQLVLGAPLPGYASEDDREADQRKEYSKFMLKVEEALFDKFGMNYAFFESAYVDPSTTSALRVRWISLAMQQEEFVRLSTGDVAFSATSMLFVFAYIWIHTGSIWLTATAMAQIMMSLPVAFFIYRVIFGITFYTQLHILAIFLVLGVGADDVFVFVDGWKQSASVCTDDRDRLMFSFHRASRSVFNTSFTTAFAFAATALSPVMPVSSFGIYAALAIVLNYVFVCTATPCEVLVWHRRWSKEGKRLREHQSRRQLLQSQRDAQALADQGAVGDNAAPPASNDASNDSNNDTTDANASAVATAEDVSRTPVPGTANADANADAATGAADAVSPMTDAIGNDDVPTTIDDVADATDDAVAGADGAASTSGAAAAPAPVVGDVDGDAAADLAVATAAADGGNELVDVSLAGTPVNVDANGDAADVEAKTDAAANSIDGAAPVAVTATPAAEAATDATLVKPVPQAEEEAAPKQRLSRVERFFRDWYAPALVYRYKGVKVISLAVVVFFLVYFSLSMYWASQLRTPEAEEEWFESKHMFNGLRDFQGSTYYAAPVDSYVEVSFVWGIAGIDRSDFVVWEPGNNRGTAVFRDSFDLSTKEAQDFILGTCQALRDRTCSQAGCTQGKLTLPGEVDCWFEEFQSWYTTKAGGTSLPTGPTFNAELQQFRAAHPQYAGKIGFVGGALHFIVIDAVASLEAFLPHFITRPVFDEFDAFAAERNALAPASVGPVFHSSQFWTWMRTEQGLVDGMWTGLTLCFPVAFLVLCAATNNIILAFYAVVCIAGIVASVLGAGENYFGWSLGIAESISAVIVIGFSVDYVVHLGHMYADSDAPDRDARVTHAATTMGVTVVAGAATTMGAGAVMLLCQMTFFTKMAWLIVLTIFFSFLTALGLFMALCALAGPQGNVGSITEMAKACWKKLK